MKKYVIKYAGGIEQHIMQAVHNSYNEAALLALRTKQKIEESFPEALPYLDFDDGKTNLPVPKYEELRNLLKK